MTETELVEQWRWAAESAVSKLTRLFTLDRSEREIAQAESLSALWLLIRLGQVDAGTDVALVVTMIYRRLIDARKMWRPTMIRTPSGWTSRMRDVLSLGGGEDDDECNPAAPEDSPDVPTAAEVRRLLGQYIPAAHLDCLSAAIVGEEQKVTAARMGRSENYVARLVMEARIKLNARQGIIRRRLGI